MDGRTDGGTDGWIDGQTGGWVDRRVCGWLGGQTGGWVIGWTDGWADRRVGGWMFLCIVTLYHDAKNMTIHHGQLTFYRICCLLPTRFDVQTSNLEHDQHGVTVVQLFIHRMFIFIYTLYTQVLASFNLTNQLCHNILFQNWIAKAVIVHWMCCYMPTSYISLVREPWSLLGQNLIPSLCMFLGFFLKVEWPAVFLLCVKLTWLMDQCRCSKMTSWNTDVHIKLGKYILFSPVKLLF